MFKLKNEIFKIITGLSLNCKWHKQHSNDSNTNVSYNYDDTQVGEDDVFMVR